MTFENRNISWTRHRSTDATTELFTNRDSCAGSWLVSRMNRTLESDVDFRDKLWHIPVHLTHPNQVSSGIFMVNVSNVIMMKIWWWWCHLWLYFKNFWKTYPWWTVGRKLIRTLILRSLCKHRDSVNKLIRVRYRLNFLYSQQWKFRRYGSKYFYRIALLENIIYIK